MLCILRVMVVVVGAGSSSEGSDGSADLTQYCNLHCDGGGGSMCMVYWLCMFGVHGGGSRWWWYVVVVYMYMVWWWGTHGGSSNGGGCVYMA